LVFRVVLLSSLRLGDVIFSKLECDGVERFLRFSRKRQDGSAPNFFQGLEENTCSLQPALKNKTLHRPFNVVTNNNRPSENAVSMSKVLVYYSIWSK